MLLLLLRFLAVDVVVVVVVVIVVVSILVAMVSKVHSAVVLHLVLVLSGRSCLVVDGNVSSSPLEISAIDVPQSYDVERMLLLLLLWMMMMMIHRGSVMMKVAS